MINAEGTAKALPTAVHDTFGEDQFVDAMAEDSRLHTWLRWLGYGAMVFIIVFPFAAISWGRAQRSASAPVVLEEVYPQGNGRFTVGAYSFSVGGRIYRDEDAGPRARRGERTWSRDDLEGMQVCYDPDRPGEDFALTPPHYQCGDPEIITSDGGVVSLAARSRASDAPPEPSARIGASG